MSAGDAEVLRLVDAIKLSGTKDPFIPSPFKTAEMIAGMQMAIATIGNLITKLKTGSYQDISMNMDHAAMMLFGPMALEWKIEGGGTIRENTIKLAESMPEDPDALFRIYFVGVFTTCDGYIFLFPKFDSPEELLEACGLDKKSVPHILSLLRNNPSLASQKAFVDILVQHMKTQSGKEIEARMQAKKIGTVVVPKTKEEWLATEQGALLASRPFADVTFLPNPPSLRQPAPNPTWPSSSLPLAPNPTSVTSAFHWPPAPFRKGVQGGLLAGVKILELTRALMGPTIGTTLAPYGCDIIRVSDPLGKDYNLFDTSQTVGKRCISLNLKNPADKKVFTELLMEADVFVQNSNYGAVERLGFGVNDVLELIKGREKGILYVEGNTFGFIGPLATVPGIEFLGQFSVVLGVEQGKWCLYDPEPEPGEATRPSAISVSCCDVPCGVLNAVGIMAGLYRRAVYGGSYLVQSSLVQSAMFLDSLGRYSNDAAVWEIVKRYPPMIPGVANPGHRFPLGTSYWGFFHELMRDAYTEGWKDDYWMWIRNLSGFGGDMRVLRPGIKFSATPATLKIAPRPQGFDKDTPMRWIEGWSDVKQVEDGVYVCLPVGKERPKL